MNDYQLIVIGAGPGGYAAACRAAGWGMRTAIVEDREAGGTCLNRGCVPTKILLHASKLYRDICAGSANGIEITGAHMNMDALFAHKRQVTEKLSAGVRLALKNAKVDWLEGRGTVTERGTVEVKTGEDVKKITADHILIATGSVPAALPVPGLDLPGVMNSDEILEGCDHLYQSLVIIGGGVIGVEFAAFYSDLGCAVTIIEGTDSLLPAMDREISRNLAMILKKRGIKLYTGSMLQKIEKKDMGLEVSFRSGDTVSSVVGEAVLCAVGRKPNLEGVFADGILPKMEGKRLWVDEHFQTSIPGIYAVGDVASRIQLAHAATAQGLRFADLLCGKDNFTVMDVVPGCVYCRPEIASVGMTEQEAKEQGIPVKVGKCGMYSNARTVIAAEDRCFMKIVARQDDHRILGGMLMCENSTDMISEIAQAIANRMTVEQLLAAMRPHPTFEEALTEALENFLRKA